MSRSAAELDEKLENAIRSLRDYQCALGNHPHAYTVAEMADLLKRQRRPQLVTQLDQQRLERARAA